jgi:uncharacterized protein YndB with AHSA1/START domain
MRIALITIGVIVALVVIVAAIGYALPVKHRGIGEATFKATPETIFTLITNVDGYTTWRSGLKSVETIPSTDGRKRFRELSGHGPIAFVFESVEPNNRLVARIDEKSLPFGGTWIYDVIPTSDGRTTLRITEDGEIYNPVFRFVSRFFTGYDTTIKKYLADVGRKVGG